MSFSLDISRFAKTALADAATVQRKVCLDLSAGVINDTPVDTGRARANWQPAVNRVADTALSATDASGAATIAKVVDTLKELRPGDTFTLVNNVPYILALEDGSSKQAPQGMLKRNLERFPGVVRAAADEVR